MNDCKMMFLGDSIIEGYGVEPEECWVSCLSEDAVNCGVSGDTTRDVLRRFAAIAVNGRQVQSVVLLIGINDLLNGQRVPSVTARMEQLIQRIQELPAEPVLCTYPEPDYDELLSGGYVPESMYSFPERLKELHRWIRLTCRSNHFRCIDFAQGMQERAGQDRCRLFLDGVHPNRYGHLMMSEIAREILE